MMDDRRDDTLRTSDPKMERGETEWQASDEGFLPPERMDDLRRRWSELQVSFVDDPRNAVQQAHQLVTQLVNDLTDTFTRERSNLESQWSGGREADTEALRVALQRYRSFFNRLLGTNAAES
jgi:hypothetical protein